MGEARLSFMDGSMRHQKQINGKGEKIENQRAIKRHFDSSSLEILTMVLLRKGKPINYNLPHIFVFISYPLALFVSLDWRSLPSHHRSIGAQESRKNSTSFVCFQFVKELKREKNLCAKFHQLGAFCLLVCSRCDGMSFHSCSIRTKKWFCLLLKH